MSNTDEIDDSTAPLIEHLAELRSRLIHSVAAFLVGMIICFTVATPIFNFLTAPLCQYQTIRVSQHPPAKKRAVSGAPFQLSAI